MGHLFNMDNPVWVAMGKLADLIILNCLVVICSLPVFTIGASWTALYFVTVRMVKKEESYITKDFFHSFKENFKQATIIWMMILLVLAVFALDYRIYKLMPGVIPKPVIVAVLVVAVILMVTTIYVFPVLSRFQNTIKNTIKNAFLMSVVHVPYTIVFLLLLLLPIVACLVFWQFVPFVAMVGISVPAYWASLLWVRIFKKFEPKDEVVSGNLEEGEEDVQLAEEIRIE